MTGAVRLALAGVFVVGVVYLIEQRAPEAAWALTAAILLSVAVTYRNALRVYADILEGRV